MITHVCIIDCPCEAYIFSRTNQPHPYVQKSKTNMLWYIQGSERTLRSNIGQKYVYTYPNESRRCIIKTIYIYKKKKKIKKKEMYGQKVVRRSSLPNAKTPNTHGVIPRPDRPAIGREITHPSPWETEYSVVSLVGGGLDQSLFRWNTRGPTVRKPVGSPCCGVHFASSPSGSCSSRSGLGSSWSRRERFQGGPCGAV